MTRSESYYFFLSFKNLIIKTMIVLTMKNTTVFNITISLLGFDLSRSVYIVQAKQVRILSLWFLCGFFKVFLFFLLRKGC